VDYPSADGRPQPDQDVATGLVGDDGGADVALYFLSVSLGTGMSGVLST